MAAAPEAEKVLTQLVRHTRYLLPLKGRSPFRLAGLEPYERLSTVASLSRGLLAQHYEPRLAQLYPGLQAALSPFAETSQALHQGAAWLRDIAYILGRCCRAVDLLFSHRGKNPPSGVRRAMITQVLHCPYCHSTDIVRHGLSPEGKQRYRCRACLEERGRTFLLEYTYAGQSPEVKQQIVDMAMNASGIRDTARVLHISPTTVIKELKNRNLTCTR